jgi:hypothetical protein
MYPFNFKKGQTLQTNAPGVIADQSFLSHLVTLSAAAVAADTDGILAAVADNGAQQEITEGFTQPPVPRNVTATAGGTATDIGAIQVTIEGTNFAGEVITETLPAFTVDTAGTVSGSKAFQTVTKVIIPAHDGLGATTSIGFGDVLGLPYNLERDTVLAAYLNNTKEGTDPTVMVDADNIESNTVELNSALNGTQVDIYLNV